MSKLPQPLFKHIPIVTQDGRPTDYFVRWSQQRQEDIQNTVSEDVVFSNIEEWSINRQVTAGVGLAGGGSLDTDVSFSLSTVPTVTPSTYSNPIVSVDEYGRIVGIISGASVVIPFKSSFNFLAPPAIGQTLLIEPIVTPVEFPANFSGSAVSTGVLPTASFAMDIRRNGSSVGQIVISTTGTAVFSSSGVVAFNGGDVLSVVAPSVADLTIGNVGVTLKGVINE